MARTKQPLVVLTCAGDSDVGKLSRAVGHKLCVSSGGSCRVASSEDIPQIAEILRGRGILAIDGCGKACLRAALERQGLDAYTHLDLGDLGLSKGHTPLDQATVDGVAEAAIALIS